MKKTLILLVFSLFSHIVSAQTECSYSRFGIHTVQGGRNIPEIAKVEDGNEFTIKRNGKGYRLVISCRVGAITTDVIYKGYNESKGVYVYTGKATWKIPPMRLDKNEVTCEGSVTVTSVEKISGYLQGRKIMNVDLFEGFPRDKMIYFYFSDMNNIQEASLVAGINDQYIGIYPYYSGAIEEYEKAEQEEYEDFRTFCRKMEEAEMGRKEIKERMEEAKLQRDKIAKRCFPFLVRDICRKKLWEELEHTTLKEFIAAYQDSGFSLNGEAVLSVECESDTAFLYSLNAEMYMSARNQYTGGEIWNCSSSVQYSPSKSISEVKGIVEKMDGHSWTFGAGIDICLLTCKDGEKKFLKKHKQTSNGKIKGFCEKEINQDGCYICGYMRIGDEVYRRYFKVEKKVYRLMKKYIVASTYYDRQYAFGHLLDSI